MVDFVERGGDPCQKQPCFVEGATAHGFLLKADPAALNALVDRQLNQPCGAQAFEAHTGWVVLLVAQLGQARNSSSGGYISDIDASFWVPLRSRGVLPGAAARSFLLPYTFVSTGHGIAIGREVFGFNKMLSRFGDLQLPTNGDVRELSVETVAVRRLSLSAEAGFEEVLKLTPTDSMSMETEAPPALLEMLGTDPRQKAAPHAVFLRQLRDVAQPSRAAYQAIVEAPMLALHPLATRFGRLKHSAQVHVPDFESHPIAADLGLALDADRNTESLFGFWLQFAFELGLGKTLWEAR